MISISKTHYFTALVLFLTAQASHSQSGYIRTDSSYSQVEIVLQSKALQFREVKFKNRKTDETTVTLIPRDIVEYGFVNGATYETLNIQDADSMRLYFAKRLTDDYKVKLFMVRSEAGVRMFGKSSEGLIEIKNDDTFHPTLSTLLNVCTNTSTWVRRVKFKQRSLIRAFGLQSRCYPDTIPRIRKGVMAGYSVSTLTIEGSEGESISMGSEASPFAGIFVDYLLGRKKKIWSLSIQPYYQKNSFHKSKGNESHLQEFVSNTSFVSVPILFRYQFGETKLRKYLSLGATTSYYLKRENCKYDATLSGTIVTVQKTNYKSINQLQVGATIGAGLNFIPFGKSVCFVEMRYQYGTGLSIGDSPTHSLSSIQLVTSISF